MCRPFTPANSASAVTLAVTSSSSRVQFDLSGVRNPHVRLYNSGTVDARIETGDSGVVATNGSMTLPAGQTEVFGTLGSWVAAITASGSTSIEATAGSGV